MEDRVKWVEGLVGNEPIEAVRWSSLKVSKEEETVLQVAYLFGWKDLYMLKERKKWRKNILKARRDMQWHNVST